MGNSSSSSSRQADAGVTGNTSKLFGSGTQSALKRHLETAEKTGTLAFPNQKLDAFPPQLARAAQVLRSLDLSGNRIPVLPPTLDQFAQLRTLRMDGNRLTELPPTLGQLTKLEGLFVQGNQLTALPTELANCKNLKEINASGNKLRFVPSSLYNLKKMDMIDLSANEITSFEDEAAIGSLSATELVLNGNQIAALPEALAQCCRLKTLRLEENCLSLEAVPQSLLESSPVSSLFLAGNMFDEKKLSEVGGHDKYMERYTAVRRKLD